MWQEIRGESTFRFQTNDHEIQKRMRQRKDFSLIGWGLNTKLWIYKVIFYSPEKARKCLERITRRKIKKDALNGVFFAKTSPIVAPKNKSQTHKADN